VSSSISWNRANSCPAENWYERVKVEPPDGDVSRNWGRDIAGLRTYFVQQNVEPESSSGVAGPPRHRGEDNVGVLTDWLALPVDEAEARATSGAMLSGCLAVWLSGCLAVWLSGCLAVWLSGWAVWAVWVGDCYRSVSTRAICLRGATRRGET
jgi:hypothetical protein